MKILFICKHNRFRSKVAEFYFNHFNKNKKNVAKSAGASLDPLHHFIAPAVLSVLKEQKIKLGSEEAIPITQKAIDWADKIVIVADNVSQDIFPKSKTEVWPTPDCSQDDLPAIKKSMKMIENHIKHLVDSLK